MKHFADLLKNTKPLFGNDLVFKTNNVNGDVRIHYTDQSHFENIASQFGIFEEWKVSHFHANNLCFNINFFVNLSFYFNLV